MFWSYRPPTVFCPSQASHGVNTIGIILGNCAFIGHGALADRGAPSRVFIFYFAARIETEELESEFILVWILVSQTIYLTEPPKKLQNLLRNPCLSTIRPKEN
jgi:hypothetical protein